MSDFSGNTGPIDHIDFNRMMRQMGRQALSGQHSAGSEQTTDTGEMLRKAAAQQFNKSASSKDPAGFHGKDVFTHSSDMKSQLAAQRRQYVKQTYYRNFFESKLTSFVKREPSLDDIRQAARFASSSIWDLLKKLQREGDDDEFITYLLASLMKIYSQYTFEHSERVMDWAVDLAKEMGIEEQQELDTIAKAAFFRDIGTIGSAVNENSLKDRNEAAGFIDRNGDFLRECGSLHDIGKMRIPKEIIDKTAPLTDEEFDIIKTHPLIGVEIVKPYEALKRTIPGIKHHHEKYDGTGYPDKLKGKEIPLIARIITVVDTFDAMTEDRPYRKALTYSDAINELVRLSGEQFDPELVPPFVRALLKRGDIEESDIDVYIDLKGAKPLEPHEGVKETFTEIPTDRSPVGNEESLIDIMDIDEEE